jgi:hypothetical protein
MKRAFLIVLLVTCVRGQATELSSDRVQAAVAAELSSVQAGAVLVPASLHFPQTPSRFDATQLVVDKLTISRTGHVDARVQCVPRHACLPFAVTAEVTGQISPVVWTTRYSNTPGSELRTAHGQHKARTLKLGEHVLFVRERDGVRTRIQAVTLDNATPGDIVRVRAIDGKHEILRGRLCADHLVREDS